MTSNCSATGPPLLGSLLKVGEFVCYTLLIYLLCMNTYATPLRYVYDNPSLSLKPNGIPLYLALDKENDDDNFNSS